MKGLSCFSESLIQLGLPTPVVSKGFDPGVKLAPTRNPLFVILSVTWKFDPLSREMILFLWNLESVESTHLRVWSPRFVSPAIHTFGCGLGDSSVLLSLNEIEGARSSSSE